MVHCASGRDALGQGGAAVKSREELRVLWIAALRSGDFKQGQHALKPDDGGYCCLGVLCEVAGIMDKNGIASYDGAENPIYLPPFFAQHMGMNPTGTSNIRIGEDDRNDSLANMNDRRKVTFTQIADLLETGEYWHEE